MKATGVIVLVGLGLGLLAGGGEAALLPIESMLEEPPQKQGGGGQALLPIESMLEEPPQKQGGGGQALLPIESMLEEPPQKQGGGGQIRRRRHGSHFPLCSFCCNCCTRGCGLCCRS